MSWVGWVALAVALGLSLVPSPAAVRAGELAGVGRLRARRDSTHGAGRVRALPWSWALGALGVGAVAVISAWGGAFLGAAAAALVGTGGLLGRDVLRGRAASSRHRDLLTAVRVLVGELEAGAQAAASLAAAATAGPRVAESFDGAAEVARRGGDAGAVLATAGDPDVRLIGLAWQLGDSTGSALAEVLSRVAADLAAADEQRRTVAVTLAGPRSSAAVLSGLPVLGIALGAAMGARPVPFLTMASTGRVLCCAGVLLDVAGLLWMRRIVRRAERA